MNSIEVNVFFLSSAFICSCSFHHWDDNACLTINLIFMITKVELLVTMSNPFLFFL